MLFSHYNVFNEQLTQQTGNDTKEQKITVTTRPGTTIYGSRFNDFGKKILAGNFGNS